jgi:hypothetical protein
MLKVEQPAKHSPFGISNETWKSQSRWSINLVGGFKGRHSLLDRSSVPEHYLYSIAALNAGESARRCQPYARFSFSVDAGA